MLAEKQMLITGFNGLEVNNSEVYKALKRD